MATGVLHSILFTLGIVHVVMAEHSIIVRGETSSQENVVSVPANRVLFFVHLPTLSLEAQDIPNFSRLLDLCLIMHRLAVPPRFIQPSTGLGSEAWSGLLV